MSRRRIAAPLIGLALAIVTSSAVLVFGRGATRPAAAAVTVVRTSSGGAAWSPEIPLYVLLLGDDARPGAGCGCSDAIHLVGIPAGGGQATMVNIPRDTRVTIPGHGTGKVNEALALGGPQLAADTIGGFVGVPVTYAFVVGFDAFPGLVDELGGVVVDVPVGINDRSSGANFEPGPAWMDGANALAYSRARKTVDGGDFGRTTNQATFIISALAQLQAIGTAAPDEIHYLGTLLRHVRADGISVPELYRLGRVALTVDVNAFRSITMPGGVGTIGGTSYVLAGSAAGALFADFADDAVLQAH